MCQLNTCNNRPFTPSSSRKNCVLFCVLDVGDYIVPWPRLVVWLIGAYCNRKLRFCLKINRPETETEGTVI